MIKYKALLFGSIGTIVETSEIQRKSFNSAFRIAGLKWNWTKEIYKNLLNKSGVEETKASLIFLCLLYFIISLTPVLNLSLFFFK